MIFYGIIVFLLGLIIGSFLNVVILRYNTGKSLGGRSGCMSCGSKLETATLIPVFSYLFLKGKCKDCGSKISTQYPVVEFTTALLFLSIFLFFYNSLFINPLTTILNILFFFVVTSIFIIIFVYDIRHKIIPNGLSYTLAILALIYRLILTPFDHLNTLAILDLFSGLILFMPFYLLWLFSKGKWIGLGDGKLVLSIGWLLGFIYGISAVISAFWLGAIISITILLTLRLKQKHSHITMKTEIPFAPFLILGLLIVFFFPVDVLGIGLFF